MDRAVAEVSAAWSGALVLDDAPKMCNALCRFVCRGDAVALRGSTALDRAEVCMCELIILRTFHRYVNLRPTGGNLGHTT